MPTVYPLRNWEDCLHQRSWRRRSAAPNWSRASTISAPLSWARIRPDSGRRGVFLASDEDGAASEVGALAEELGFAPIDLGGLSEGGLLVQARGNSWGRLIF